MRGAGTPPPKTRASVICWQHHRVAFPEERTTVCHRDALKVFSATQGEGRWGPETRRCPSCRLRRGDPPACAHTALHPAPPPASSPQPGLFRLPPLPHRFPLFLTLPSNRNGDFSETLEAAPACSTARPPPHIPPSPLPPPPGLREGLPFPQRAALRLRSAPAGPPQRGGRPPGEPRNCATRRRRRRPQGTPWRVAVAPGPVTAR